MGVVVCINNARLSLGCRSQRPMEDSSCAAEYERQGEEIGQENEDPTEALLEAEVKRLILEGRQVRCLSYLSHSITLPSN